MALPGTGLAPDVVEAGGVSPPNLFWLSWVVGGLGCGVVSTIIKGH
ncbi:hypothetical protein [uncultured Parolsenella sp.]|nr:hypothetical protein [uncultured Parolsenella sp.]